MNCKLLPYKKKPILSAQDLRQKLDWGIQAFRLPEAWAHAEGEGVVIAVIDTGCDITHPDLVDNLLPGINFVQPGEPPIDDGEHGTHITGIICATNNSVGVVGVAPKAKVRPVKVLDADGNGEVNDVAKGIRWAIDQKVDFISMSLGSPHKIPQVRRAIKKALDAGIVVFAAAGNMGKSKELLYPANYPETISIGAIGKDMKRADFSNTGLNLDFLAPGVDILSTVPDNWYAILSGSSMAQPFVCGLAALILSYKRKKNLQFPLATPNDYRKLFQQHTINVVGETYAGDKFFQGFGIITVDKLLTMIT